MRKDNENLVASLIRCERINVSKYKYNIEGVFDFATYYEMPLYCFSDNSKWNDYYQLIYQANKKNTEGFEFETKRIISMLEGNSIKYCVLAGIPLANIYHESPELRLQEDIDFFVLESDFEKIRLLMSTIGYHEYNYQSFRKHITFINTGFTGKDKSIDGRRAVKFYRRISDYIFFKETFEDFIPYTRSQNNVNILSTEAALVHLLAHCHYYDFHPKILADIYMVCKNGDCNWKEVIYLVNKIGAQRIFNLIMMIMQNLGLSIPYLEHEDDVQFLAEMLTTDTFWSKFFTRLNAKEMTKFRCYCYNSRNYRKIFDSIMQQGQERRVSPERNEFRL